MKCYFYQEGGPFCILSPLCSGQEEMLMWFDGAAAICVMNKLMIQANTASNFIVVSETICLYCNCHISMSFLIKLTSQP